MRLSRSAASGAIGIILAVVLSATAMAQEHVFRLHHFMPADSPAQKQMLEPWARAVEENAGGKVRIDIYPAMSLGGKPSELVQQARDGVVDLVWTVNGYTPGLFPRTEVFELPTIHVNDPVATNLAMYDLFKEQLVSEYSGLEVMFLHVHAGQGIHTVDSAVRTPTDLTGRKMGVTTRTGGWLIEALGAVPVPMPVAEIPQALSGETVDGAFIPWEVIASLNIQDQTRYQIEGYDLSRFGNTAFQLSMNADRWMSLPEDIRNAFGNASGPDWSAKVGELWRAMDDAGIELAIESGNSHITLTRDASAAFDDIMAPLVDRWIAQMAEKQIDGQSLVDNAREAIADHSR